MVTRTKYNLPSFLRNISSCQSQKIAMVLVLVFCFKHSLVCNVFLVDDRIQTDNAVDACREFIQCGPDLSVLISARIIKFVKIHTIVATRAFPGSGNMGEKR